MITVRLISTLIDQFSVYDKTVRIAIVRLVDGEFTVTRGSLSHDERNDAEQLVRNYWRDKARLRGGL